MIQGYQLLDAGDFRKLEQVGPYRIVRPAAGAVWSPRLPRAEWERIDAEFFRHSGGDGRWEYHNASVKTGLTATIELPGWKMQLKSTEFGHLGLFAEQFANWQELSRLATPRDGTELRVLNLFAYTGGSTLACASAGAHVVHLDASKTTVTWARENAERSGMSEHPIRWIVDDVKKFVARECRRETKYHGIILDPPSYGRGPKGQIWKIEDDLPELLTQLFSLLDPDFRFFLLSAHSQGYTPIALENMLRPNLPSGKYMAREMCIPGDTLLPSGASCLFERDNT